MKMCGERGGDGKSSPLFCQTVAWGNYIASCGATDLRVLFFFHVSVFYLYLEYFCNFPCKVKRMQLW